MTPRGLSGILGEKDLRCSVHRKRGEKVMALCCGCQLRGGAPVSPETLQKHWNHTIEVVLFWELLRRPEGSLDGNELKLTQARLDLFKAIEERFPEASKGGP